ncbi:MAG: hypothetical protein ACRD3G_28565 [Vicinamibacterales bacterium]
MPRRQPVPRPVEIIASPVAPRDLDLDIRQWEDWEGFVLIASFNGNRYRGDGVAALLASMRDIVKELVDRPDWRVSECERFMTPVAAADTSCGHVGSCARCSDVDQPDPFATIASSAV